MDATVEQNMSVLRTYLEYLWQKGWDTPCPQFRKTAAELVRRGWARRRWLFFGKYGVTRRGVEELFPPRIVARVVVRR